MMRCSQVSVFGSVNGRGFGKFVRGATVRALLGFTLAAAILSEPALQAQSRPRRKAPTQAEMDQDYPFQTACIGTQFPAGNVAYKGIAIKLDNDAYVCFDTDLLRMAAGWTG